MEKRKLRSDTAAAGRVAPATDSAPMNPKRRKTSHPMYLCTCCDTEKQGRYFPDYNPSSECDHTINTCRACLKQWIQTQIESSNFVRIDGQGGSTFGIKCIECKATMRPVNVEAAAASRVYDKFDRLARRHLAESIPNWRWCLASNCDNGQEHAKEAAQVPTEPLLDKKRGGRKKKVATTGTAASEVTADICTCTKCGARACARCDVPWHKGETCKEYQERTQDVASRMLIKKTFKKCPNCSRNIEKDGGCDYMHCTQCNTPFCWRCVQVFQDRSYCGCHPRPIDAGNGRQ